MRRSLLVWFLVLTITLEAQTGKEGVKASDMVRIKQPAALQVSPDGNKVYFTLTTIDPDPDKKWEYQYQTQIWSLNTDGSSPARQLTSSKEGASQIELSPDGQQIVFVKPVDGKLQLFLLPLNGGEAIQLTRMKYGASFPRWSPDSKQIAFVSTIGWRDLVNDSMLNPSQELPAWFAEKPGFSDNSFLLNSNSVANPDGSIEEARSWLQQNEKDKKAKLINRLQFQEESTTNGDLNISRVFITQAIPGSTVIQMTHGFNSISNPQFLSNNELLVESKSADTIHPDRSLTNGLYKLNIDRPGLRPFLVLKNMNCTGAAVSSSGKWIAFQYSPPGFINIPQLAVIPSSGQEKDMINIPFDRSKYNLVWKGDETLYGLALSNGGSILFRYDLKARKFSIHGSVDEGIVHMTPASKKLLYVKASVSNPFEIYTSDEYTKTEQRISSLNEELVRNKQLIQPEKHSFVNEKGLRIEYWVMKPLNFEPGKKYPLLLEIHGGPAAMWGPGETSMWHEFQFWCSKGYGVVYSNPRGSGGYGLEFLKANVKDWGNGPMKDVLTAFDKTVSEGWADTTRLFATGGSYAGYLVSYILGHDKRFRAACSQRGVYDLRTFFGEGNAWRLVPNYFGGYPWEPQVDELLDKESSITYVQNITTPLLIFHGENDLRTGVIQSEELYKSLKVLGRPVEYVRHPGATHEITRSGNNRQRMDQLIRTWEFFERFR
jgi:dipeptidyl aminopeptidase/acylaminoacyl peptidase